MSFFHSVSSVFQWSDRQLLGVRASDKNVVVIKALSLKCPTFRSCLSLGGGDFRRFVPFLFLEIKYNKAGQCINSAQTWDSSIADNMLT